MNGITAKILRKVAKVTGRNPNYIKTHYKELSPEQRVAYITFIKSSLLSTERKEVSNGATNLPIL